ncbi:MAG: signal recognition particle receptor subunit alpha, partial [Pseudomonadota bacterium]|nr:signal recognition particle receptor subunit alpha [Pseudomonadota bacterium]
MFDFFKRKKKSPENAQPADQQAPQQVEETNDVAEASEAANLVPEAPLVQSDAPVSETEEILQKAVEPVPEPVTEAVPEKEEPSKKEAPQETAAPSEPEIKADVAASQIAADDLAAEPEDVVDPDVMVPVPEKAKDEKKGFFGRMAAGLSKTRSNLTDGLSTLLLGKKEIDDDMMEDLETQLIMADVGVEATTEIIDRLTKRVGRKELRDSDALYEALIEELQDMLAVSQKPLVIDSSKKPYVILMVGINGVGKTTTIGKLAKQFQARGKSVMLAAGDTFRAAAVEQLQVWGERNNVPVVAQHTGADSASVLFDAVQAATSRGVDILIADTAGRLHNKDNLMQEL